MLITVPVGLREIAQARAIVKYAAMRENWRRPLAPAPPAADPKCTMDIDLGAALYRFAFSYCILLRRLLRVLSISVQVGGHGYMLIDETSAWALAVGLFDFAQDRPFDGGAFAEPVPHILISQDVVSLSAEHDA